MSNILLGVALALGAVYFLHASWIGYLVWREAGRQAPLLPAAVSLLLWVAVVVLFFPFIACLARKRRRDRKAASVEAGNQ